MSYKEHLPKVLKCRCINAGQDKIHGHGRRLHNACKTAGDVVGYRCTVCEAVKQGKR